MGLAGRRPLAVLAVALVVAVGAGFAATTLRLETDLFSLVPRDNPIVSEFRLTVQRFGSLDLMLLAVELPKPSDDGDRAELEREAVFVFADLLAAELRALPQIDWLEYRLEDVVQAAGDLVSWAPMVMDDQGFERFLSRIESREGLDRAAAELAQAMRSPADLPRKRLRLMDPLDMVPSALRRLDMAEQRFDVDTGYLIDPKKTLLLMVMGPSDAPANLPFSKQLLADLRAAGERAEQAWRESGQDLELPTPALMPAGGHVIAAEDGRLIGRDLAFGTLLTLVSVVVLFAWAFGRVRALSVAFVPLLLGLVITAGAAALVLGRLNAVTAAFGALLLGLGIDFVIVLYGRYLELRSQGNNHTHALSLCAEHTVPSILLGAATTAVTFFAFLVSDFAGLWELGVLTGGGILIVAVTVLWVLPAFLTRVEGRAERQGSKKQERFELRAFGARRLFEWSLRHPRSALVMNLALSLVLGFFAFQIKYDSNVLSMRSSKNFGAVNQQRIVDAFGLRFTPFMVRVDGADEEAVLAKGSEIYSRLAPLADGHALARVDGVVHLLPPFELQRERLSAIREALDRRSADAATIRQELEQALAGQGLKPAAFSRGLDQLEAALALEQPRGPSALLESGLGPWAQRYFSFHEHGVSTVIYGYPPSSRREVPAALVQELADVGAVVTGPVMISDELKRVVWNDAMLAGVLGTIVVFLCLVWDLKSWIRGLLALLPLGLGLVWMLGLMAWIGVPMNYLNVFVLTMILGIGVDYGIHLFHRFGESGGLESAAGLAPAIAVAALTTLCGFGSLVFSHVPGLRSMGWAAMLGVVSVAWLTLTLLPACLQWWAQRGRLKTQATAAAETTVPAEG